MEQTLTGSYPQTDVTMTLTNTPPIVSCRVRYAAVDVTAGGMIPSAIGSVDKVYVAANGLDIDLRYFVRIATP
jgi:hypothetical protein